MPLTRGIPRASIPEIAAGTGTGFMAPPNFHSALSENDGTPSALQLAVKAAATTASSGVTRSVAIGLNALEDAPDGELNIMIGESAGRYLHDTVGQPLQNGTGNVGIGGGVLSAVGASCDYNTAVGLYALSTLTTGYDNAAVGAGAMQFATTPQYCVAIGANALGDVATGDNNTALGAKALFRATSANNNLAAGTSALYTTTIGGFNVALGSQSMRLSEGADNTVAVGAYALENVTADGNVAVGYFAGRNVSVGTGNTLIGRQAGTALTIGLNNTLVGDSAGSSLVSGGTSVAVGESSLNRATGAGNTAVGQLSGYGVTTGTQNTYVGRNAGYSHNGTACVLIGATSDAAAAYNYSTAIGYGSAITASYQFVLGASDITETVVHGKPTFKTLAASATPAVNGEMTIEKTSNTALTFKLKGSDGTVRSGTMVLA